MKGAGTTNMFNTAKFNLLQMLECHIIKLPVWSNKNSTETVNHGNNLAFPAFKVSPQNLGCTLLF